MNFTKIISMQFVFMLFVSTSWAQTVPRFQSQTLDMLNGTRNFAAPSSSVYGTYNFGAGFAAPGAANPVLDLMNITRAPWNPPKKACYSLYCDDQQYRSIGNRNAYLQQGITNIFDDYCPAPMPETSIDKVAQATDVAACYKDRNSSLAANLNEYQKFEEDRRVCDCLRNIGSTVTEVGSIMNTKFDQIKAIRMGDVSDIPSGEQRMQNFEDNIKEVRREMDQNSNGMAFQASVLADLAGKPVKENDVDNFARVYATDPLGRTRLSLIDDARERRGGGFLGLGKPDERVSRFAGTFVGAETQSLNLIDATLGVKNRNGRKQSSDERSNMQRLDAAMDTLARPGAPVRELLQPVDIKSTEPRQCVSAREFMAFKQMPDEKVLKELQNSDDPMKWNHKVLRKEWSDLMALPYPEKQAQKEKIVALRSRIVFLERNPLIKNFLAAESTGLDDFLKAVPNDDEEGIKAAYGPDLENRKKALLNFIRVTLPSRNCGSPECMVQTPQMAEGLQKVLAFFAKPENAKVTITENNRANASVANKFLSSGKALYARQPSAISRIEVDSSFQTFGLGSPATCDQQSALDVCVRTFAGYCQFIDTKKNEINNLRDQDPELLDDLKSKTANLFETDPNKNPEFKNFIKSACDTKRRTSSRDQNGNYKTFWEYFDSKCPRSNASCNTPEKIQELRAEYLSTNPEPAVPGEGVDTAQLMAFNKMMTGTKVGKGASSATVAAMSGGSAVGGDISSLLNSASRDWGFDDEMSDSVGATNSKIADAGISNADVSAKVDNKIDNSSVIDDGMMNPNYSMSGAAGVSNAVAGSDQPQKVENMTDPQRQELLDDWQKEYDQWKQNKGNDNSAVASANEAAMKARIEALEALLTQQKKLTEDQYKLLNDAIAQQNRAAQNPVVAQNQPEGSSSSSNGRNRSTTAISGSSDEEAVNRGPASVPEQRLNTAGAGAGAGSAGVGSGAPSSRRSGGGSSSDDSVAREEAKLVNMRRFADGSITIEATTATSAASANAVSVPVSDEQYRALAANPTSLNLSQIERSIPSDQIARLQENGEITILLRNGSNPPFEVKVEKKNNKLVYSLKDKNGREQAPVRRVFTRQSLELQLKANR